MRTRAKIVAAAFDVFGDEAGLYARMEDVAERAALTRATLYNHFGSMAELREALAFEVTHDFLNAVTKTISTMADARDRSACAVRFYLRRAQSDRRWAWSMINLSATGFIFGAETFRQAEETIREGIGEGVFPIPSAELGRDLLLGTTLAAMGSVVRGAAAENYPELVAGYILFGLGVPMEQARHCAHQALPRMQDEFDI
ncbi:MAG: TetR/AcrR family transcriptional regulator [Sphingobium sp.]|nr:TetR/AcrR family transcriptional regulator [Sphingobium sp.]